MAAVTIAGFTIRGSSATKSWPFTDALISICSSVLPSRCCMTQRYWVSRWFRRVAFLRGKADMGRISNGDGSGSNRRQHLFEHRERIIEIRFGVGEGEETSFVGRRREVDALGEAAPEEFLKQGEILFHDVVHVHDFAIGEEQAEHRANTIDAVRDAFLSHQLAQAGFKISTEFV